MKKELLAPAGDFISLKAAIHNGADAVYLAGKSFGARKFAKNFSNEELVEAVSYAHLYAVKIYITVNTIIYEDEIDTCLKYIEFLYNIGVDAVIVQDIGLIRLIRKYLPLMEIHASTQAHTHNIEQIKLLESLGVKRVVLAREMSLKEINNLDIDMELEIFIHGALCISYSGECLFSSGVLGRSGNRGECAGLCRCPYNLIEDNKMIMSDKYLLSPKEFNSTEYIEELKKSKAYSFKIEGRMKSPEYVGYVTRIYRKLIDNDNYKLSEEEIFNLKSLYNRGFTKGYLFNTTDKDFISLNSSNHLGVKVGEVITYTKDKIKIKLSHELNQEDAVRLPNNKGMYVNFLYDHKMMLVNKAKAGDIVYLDNKVNLKELGSVSLTINNKLVQELSKALEKKIDITSRIKAHINETLEVSYSDGINTVEYKGKVVDQAKSSPLTKERIKEVLSKLGNTPFNMTNIECEIDDNIFIPVGVLNEIRRSLVDKLIHKRCEVKRHTTINLDTHKKEEHEISRKVFISALARSEEQINTLLELKVDYIYVPSKELYNKYKSKKVFLRLDRVNNNLEVYKNDKLLIGETGSLRYALNNEVFGDYYLNVVNSSYVDYLASLGVKRVTISPELTMDRIRLMMQNINSNVEIEAIIYGRIEYMIMKYKMSEVMNFKDNSNYELEDKEKRRFPIISDKYTHLMSNSPINLLDKIKELKEVGVNVFRLELYDEQIEKIREIVEEIRKY